MHDAVRGWVSEFRTADTLSVLDIGGRNLNGDLKAMFPNAVPYDVLDLRPAPDVTIVADAADWVPAREYDLVLCTEVFEHTPRWPEILMTAYRALRPGGWLIGTCAGPGRPAHSGIEATPITPGEYYENVSAGSVRAALEVQGWIEIEVRSRGDDTQWVAIKPAARPPVRAEAESVPATAGAGWCAPSPS